MKSNSDVYYNVHALTLCMCVSMYKDIYMYIHVHQDWRTKVRVHVNMLKCTTCSTTLLYLEPSLSERQYGNPAPLSPWLPAPSPSRALSTVT